MSGQPYVGNLARTFQEGLVYLLEHDYGVLGSRKVLELLAGDVEALIEQFYPSLERVPSGWLVMTGTEASGAKIHPGQAAGEHHLVTLAWPLVTEEDVRFLVEHGEGKAARQEGSIRRLVRLIEYGEQHQPHPVLLTQADLGIMLNLTTVQVSDLLRLARQQTGKALLTKGYFFDQGMRPTHKAEIIALYEAGFDEAEVARISGHAQQSVGQYIRDYERVKKMITKQIPLEQIGPLIDLQPNVVAAYAQMTHENHPELFAQPEMPTPK